MPTQFEVLPFGHQLEMRRRVDDLTFNPETPRDFSNLTRRGPFLVNEKQPFRTPGHHRGD